LLDVLFALRSPLGMAVHAAEPPGPDIRLEGREHAVLAGVPNDLVRPGRFCRGLGELRRRLQRRIGRTGTNPREERLAFGLAVLRMHRRGPSGLLAAHVDERDDLRLLGGREVYQPLVAEAAEGLLRVRQDVVLEVHPGEVALHATRWVRRLEDRLDSLLED